MFLRSRLAALPVGRAAATSLMLSTAGALLLVLLTLVRSWLPSTPIWVTGQVLAVMLLGGLLGPRLAPAAVLEYLAFGLAGLHIFMNFGAGVATLAGFTGGYLLAFAPAAALYGAIYERFAGRAYQWRFTGALLAGAAAIAVIYAGGWAWLVAGLHMTPAHAFQIGVAPFAPIDAGKALLAASALALWRRRVEE